MKKKKQKYYYVFIDNSGHDDQTECNRMTGDEIREMVQKRGLQEGIAIVDGDLIKGFDSKVDLNRL